MRSHRWLTGLLLVVAAGALTGCGAIRELKGDDAARVGAIEAKIRQARDMDALDCAPQELARAEAALDFARHEGREFHVRSTEERYFVAAETAAQALLDKTRPCWEAKRDSDGDGVPDLRDKCPGTPKGVKVDAQGCPLDSDGDGVPDHLDKCPGTPKGVKVDAQGCPLDSDGDGVPDYLDKCPGTPKGAPVDAQGCLKDTDGDRLTDWDETQKYRTDPNNPDTDGGTVPDGTEVLDNRTNPLDPSDDVPVKPVELMIHFDFDKADVKPEYFGEVEKVATFLKRHPGYNAVIEGHTDSVGTEEYNLKLSTRRANSVAKLLTERYGIALERITAQSLGETQPIASNDTAEGRAKNRRIYAYMEKE